MNLRIAIQAVAAAIAPLGLAFALLTAPACTDGAVACQTEKNCAPGLECLNGACREPDNATQT